MTNDHKEFSEKKFPNVEPRSSVTLNVLPIRLHDKLQMQKTKSSYYHKNELSVNDEFGDCDNGY
jgi:hypothetical protein